MKKIVFLFTFVITVTFYFTTSCYGAQKTKLFYGGNIYTLNQAIVSNDNEYFIDPAELSNILGIKYSIIEKSKTINLDYQGIKVNCIIGPLSKAGSPANIKHSLPEMIKGKLYFPFTFLDNTFNLALKYNSDKSVLYILPKEGNKAYALRNFNNLSYNYTVSLPETIALDEVSTDNKFQDNTISFKSKNNLFHADINCDELDDASLKAMKEFLNDPSLTDEEVFQKVVEYKKSYFEAMQDSYKKDFLYGVANEDADDSNMKVFKNYSQKVFGKESHIQLYNVIKSDKLLYSEEIHVNISVPVYALKTIYSVNFTIKKGNLSLTSLKHMSDFLNAVEIAGLEDQTDPVELFSDQEWINSANLGIYPDLDNLYLSYDSMTNRSLGYKITYPVIFIPYMENNIIDSYDYRRFKINYNNYFALSVEPVFQNTNAIFDKIKQIKEIYRSNMTLLGESKIKFLDNEFYYIDYKVNNDNGTSYVSDYFIVHDESLYRLQLNSRFIKPSDKIRNEFMKIVCSLDFIEKQPSTDLNASPIKQYINKEEGYAFSYPTQWQLNENRSNDINYDAYSIISPDVSGPVNILITEGEFNSKPTDADILSFSSTSNPWSIQGLIKQYSAPYAHRAKQLLSYNVHTGDKATFVYKLVNYLDESDRNKVGYSIDIIRNQKIVSLFISISDYAVAGGKIFDETLNSIINSISRSFHPEDTLDYRRRDAVSESRNKKVVFIEEYFKSKLGESASITSAVNLDSNNYILATVDGIPESGFYKIKMDYTKKSVTVLDKILKSDIWNCPLGDLTNQYGIYFLSLQDVVNAFKSQASPKRNSISFYSEISKSAGYYTMEADPSDNDFFITAFTPIEAIFSKIKESYSTFTSNYEMVNIEVGKRNKFEIYVYLNSRQNGSSKIEKIRVVFNKETGEINLR